METLKRPHFTSGGYTISPAEEDFLQELSSHWGEELAQAPSLYPPNAASVIAHLAVLMPAIAVISRGSGAARIPGTDSMVRMHQPRGSQRLEPRQYHNQNTEKDLPPRLHSEASSGSRISVNFGHRILQDV